MKLTRSILAPALAAVLLAAPASLISGVAVAAEPAKEEKKTKRVPAMRSKVYNQLAKAQKLADEGKIEEAFEQLDRVQGKSRSMNSYEIAMMHNFYAFIHYNKEDFGAAASAFELVIAQDPIPEGIRLSTIYSLAQLYMMQEKFEKTLEYLDIWLTETPVDKIKPTTYLFQAQAYYQMKDYAAALTPISKAIDMTVSEGGEPKENWYVLQRAIYYELKQPKKVAEVLEIMVEKFNTPKYWTQLAGMYGELEQEEKQLGVMEAAYQQGFVTKRTDYIALSQLYVFNKAPYKGAALLEKAMKDGIVETDIKNLKFVAQSYAMAKDDDKAIPAYIEAAKLAEDGKVDALLAQTYLNMELFDKAIESANVALQKGDLDKPGIAYIVLGMSYFNLKQFDNSLKALESALEHKESRRMANQWMKYVKKEKATAKAFENV